MGTLVYMSDENYNKVMDESLHKTVTKSDIEAVYEAYKEKHGNDTNRDQRSTSE